MILKIMGFDMEIHFDDCSNNVLIIEDHTLYAKIISLLCDIINEGNQSNEIVLINDNKESVFKNSVILTDVFNIDLNTKANLTKLHSLICSNIEENNEILYKFREYIEKTNCLVQDEIAGLNLEFEYLDEISIVNYLKVIGLKFCFPNLCVFDKLLAYLEMMSELFCSKNIIICNSLAIFTNEQINQICKVINYKHLNVLFIENSLNCRNKFKKYVIDNDLCEIVI